MRHSSLFVAAGLPLALLVSAQAVEAETCGEKIARLQKVIKRTPASEDTPGVALPESTDAKLHHQPTVASVDKAIRQSDADLLDDARLLDAQGDETACLKKIRPLERR
jgi:hypothetical protein